ncbi:MAG: prepilin-type N-terminal cleavage/methylation domain-containing protein [bacterium]|nr:prepilin-type N-terminal cleavage/methylation domain-containing protein [bacterium]
MKRQQGISLSELLISLLLSSLLMTILMQFYLHNKQQYIVVENKLDTHFDLQWITNLLSDSIRRAGFTPCLGIEQLISVDRRSTDNTISALKINSFPVQSLQISRMSEEFTELSSVDHPTQLFVNEFIELNPKHSVLISDCYHAEVHHIATIRKHPHGTLIVLAKPIQFVYPSGAYLGEWLEESWFIKPNFSGSKTLHYQLRGTEELSAMVHSLATQIVRVNQKKIIKLSLGLADHKTHELLVAIRAS